MAVTGDLADLGLSDLLIMFKMRASTGILVAFSGSEGVTLHLEMGRLVRVSSTQVSQRLGERLHQMGKLSEQQLAEALRIQSSNQGTPVPLGTLLIQLGMVLPADLEAVLEGQAKEILYRALTWAAGTFSFMPSPNADDIVPLPEINIDSVILDAVRRADEWEAEREQVPALVAEATATHLPLDLADRAMRSALSRVSSFGPPPSTGTLARETGSLLRKRGR